ncbi:MAG: hypothetical protein NWF14_04050 [Candidatus Bathyarchaeota archaeon]|nr:hypothetical protein [Candidatus Bathyarchaeota archaeon]
MAKNEVLLKVASTDTKPDIEKNVARLDPDTMKRLNVTEGDFAEIENIQKYKRYTGATVLLASEEDRGKNIVRLTGPTRRNLAISLGDTVQVRKAEVSDAKKVVLAPLDKVLIPSKELAAYLRDRVFANKPLLEGDIQHAFTPVRPIAFRVVRTDPKGFVRMCEATNLVVQQKFDGHGFYEPDEES